MAHIDRERGLAASQPDLEGTERFEIRRRLGSGSFGVVYEGYDHQRQSPVALKWLSYVDADTVYRFKREFRSLADISHPNLVQLFDLSSDGDRWFFTMELIRGVSLPDHLRPDRLPPGPETLRRRERISEVLPAGSSRPPAPMGAAPAVSRRSPPPMDVEPAEIRAVFSQLARGVHALHEAGKLHRDLKCQNVMVTPVRRVVVLDFGMVREAAAVPAGDELDIAGTPLYMAPEQCAGAPVGRAADWYAVGVMLFRAITGRFPFDGRMYEVMSEKQRRAAPAPSEHALDVPSDLDALCQRLLERSADARPSGEEILRALGADTAAPRVSYPGGVADVFVGRRRELRLLEAARRATRAGEPRSLYVHGASGIGKSALVRHFLERVEASDDGTLVLEGRCYERETLPYKALDSVIDSLASHLVGLPVERCEALVPPNVSDLVRVFPVLGRVPVLREASSPLSEVPDRQEQRRRAILGLEGLLRRLTAQRDVAIFIDDLQWGDRDSATLLQPLLSRSDAPPVLWIGTYRTDEAAASPFLSALGIPDRPHDGAALVEVPELDESEARTMLELRLRGTEQDEALLDELARDAAGSPLLVDLLVRHARDRKGPARELDLGSVLRERMAELPAEASELLEVLAVRGQPLSRGIAASVVGVEGLDVALLTQLRNARLLRARQVDHQEDLELYHDRIREAVSARMTHDREVALHAGLAQALAQAQPPDAESLAYHFRGAGRFAEALQYTIDAARLAESALAFERAAELYRQALELRPEIADPAAVSDADAGALRTALADALRNAGRGAEAAQAYLEAAAGADRRAALELRRLAAEQYLFSGHLDEGRAVLRKVLSSVGLEWPEHAVRALVELLARRVQVRLRGLKFRERSPDQIPEDELLRIDVCWSVSVGFAMIDPVRGGIFQARHLLMALAAGDLSRVARAVAVEIPFYATQGASARERTDELRAIGRELAQRDGQAYTRGLLASSSGGADWLQGRWAAALELEEEALDILRHRCTGVSWLLSSSTIVLLDVLWRMGRFSELFARYPSILADASSRGDLLLEIYVRIKFRALAQLAAGRPDEAVREARAALARWSQPGFQLLHFWELFLRVKADLYAGRAEMARERLESSWPAVKRSQLLRLEMYDVTMRDLRARVAIAQASVVTGRRRAAALRAADEEAARLRKHGAPWADALAALLEAGIASTRGRRDRAADALREAARGLDAADMALHALVARTRIAQLEGADAAFDEGLDALRALQLVEPERWLDVVAPGRWT